MQAIGLAAVLLAQQHAGRHELVDLGLQLELEQRHRFVPDRIPGVVGEVTHAFERRPEVREIVGVEARQRVALREPLEQLTLEVERDVGLAVRFGNQQLLVDLAPVRIETARELGVRDQEIADGVADFDRIELVEHRLELVEQHR